MCRDLDFDESMKDFLVDRQLIVCDKVLLLDANYKEFKNKADDLYKRIQGFLPNEFKNTISELVDTLSAAEAISQDILYNYGVKDGLALKEFLNKMKYVECNKGTNENNLRAVI